MGAHLYSKQVLLLDLAKSMYSISFINVGALKCPIIDSHQAAFKMPHYPVGQPRLVRVTENSTPRAPTPISALVLRHLMIFHCVLNLQRSIPSNT